MYICTCNRNESVNKQIQMQKNFEFTGSAVLNVNKYFRIL
jgi:hypothetical protein